MASRTRQVSLAPISPAAGQARLCLGKAAIENRIFFHSRITIMLYNTFLHQNGRKALQGFASCAREGFETPPRITASV